MTQIFMTEDKRTVVLSTRSQVMLEIRSIRALHTGESFERPSPTDSNASNSTGEALQASPALHAPAAAKAKQQLPQSSRAKAQVALGVRDKGVSKVKPEVCAPTLFDACNSCAPLRKGP